MIRRALVPVVAAVAAAGTVLSLSGQGAVVSEVRAVAPPATATFAPGDVVPASALAPTAKPALPPLRQQVARSGSRSVTIPALGASLPVVLAPVRAGRVQEPPGVRAVGRVGSTRPLGARRGSTWLLFHRDTGGGGRGVRSAFFDLEDLDRGNRIVVRVDSRRIVYRVTSVRLYRADRMPSSLMARTGPATLHLSTCGGPLRMGRDGVVRWSKRIVVSARRI